MSMKHDMKDGMGMLFNNRHTTLEWPGGGGFGLGFKTRHGLE